MRRSEEYYRSVADGKRKLIELRVCVECHQVDAQPGFQKCSKCRARCAERIRELTAKRKSEGLCIRCGKVKPYKGYLKCVDCRRRHARQTNESYHWRKALKRESDARTSTTHTP